MISPAAGRQPEPSTKNDKINHATEAVEFVLGQGDLFIDASKVAYVRNKFNSVVRNLETRQFRDWLVAALFEKKKIVIRRNAIDEVISTLSGIARDKSNIREVFIRAAVSNGRYYLDLCQEGNSRAVEIAGGICRIIESPPVMFIRHDSMLALPDPEFSDINNIKLLWLISNIPEDCHILVISYLIESLRPDTPYPILEIIGEQGSAKSTTQAALREIIDPNSCNLRTIQKSLDDMFVSASSNHITSYENLSSLSPTFQDGLCTIATGGGHAKRKHYENGDEFILHAKRPVMLNGILPVVTAPDLIDRTVTLELPPIVQRKEVQLLWNEFNSNKSKILGALLMIFSQSILKLPDIELLSKHRPRLIEFTYLGCAIAEVLDMHHTEFLDVFANIKMEAVQRVLDGDAIAHAIIDWFEAKNRCTVELPLGALFEEIKSCTDNAVGWPKTAKSFGAMLKRLAPLLRQYGLNIRSLGKRGSNVQWHISPCDN